MRDAKGRFIKGVRSNPQTEFKKGQKAWNNKGRNCDGYIKVYTPDGRRIREHRWVMEQVLGRRLSIDEIVHHKNGDRRDNRPENLQVMSRSQHNRIDILPKRWGGVYV